MKTGQGVPVTKTGDMQKMALDSLTREWWKLTDPCQEPVESAGEGVWWADMEEVYHLD
jgi:L-rhamnose mutarotase